MIHLVFAKKDDLASLKSDVDESDFHKLKTVPFDLSKLSSVVNNDVVKRTVYDKLVTKVNAIDTNEFVLKFNVTIINYFLKMKYLMLVDLLKKKDYNTKIIEIEGTTTSITDLATTTALSAVENKIPDVSNQVRKKQIMI